MEAESYIYLIQKTHQTFFPIAGELIFCKVFFFFIKVRKPNKI